MHRFLFILLAYIVGLSAVVSCSETENDDTEYENWQARNDDFFEQQYQRALDSIAKHPDTWKIIKSYSKDQAVDGAHTDYIIVHVLEQRTPHDECTVPPFAETPYYSDSIRVHFQGNLIPSSSHNVASTSFIAKGYMFDASWYGEYNAATMVPSSYIVSGLNDGFATALQHMHVGDRWEVCIPYQLAYNANSSSTIPAYSVLIFDMTLHSFARSGQSLPSFQ